MRQEAAQEIMEVNETSPSTADARVQLAAAQAVVDERNRALQERHSRRWQEEAEERILQEQGLPFEVKVNRGRPYCLEFRNNYIAAALVLRGWCFAVSVIYL
jgi:hypothetical protein